VLDIDRPTLASFVGVGLAWLLLLSPPWGSDGTEDVVSFLIGVVYVVAGGLWLASAAKRIPDTAWEQVIIPGLLWLVTIVFWTVAWAVTVESDRGVGHLADADSLSEDIGHAIFLGTASFLIWLLPSLGIRRSWRWIVRERPRHQGPDTVGGGLG
jgi:hypothetical protein